MAETTVIQKIRATYWQAFVFANTQTRNFYCNAILFNNQGTGNAFINDVYLLQPGDTLSLNCDQNEIDNTTYKISFTAGFVNKLGVMVKYNEGSTLLMLNKLASLTSPGDRRQQNKKYILRRKRGDF